MLHRALSFWLSRPRQSVIHRSSLSGGHVLTATPQSEDTIYNSIETWLVGKTTNMVSHRWKILTEILINWKSCICNQEWNISFEFEPSTIWDIVIGVKAQDLFARFRKVPSSIFDHPISYHFKFAVVTGRLSVSHLSASNRVPRFRG